MKKLIEKTRKEYLEEGFAVGKTIENDKIRAHRFYTSIRVTDLTNAGKRGKKVDQFALYSIDRVQDPKMLRLIEQFATMVLKTPNYKKLLAVAESLVKDAKEANQSNPDIEKTVLRGVDVAPTGFKKIEIHTPYLYGWADNSGFSVRDLKDPNNEPTIIAPMRAKVTNVKKFYEWISANQAKWEKLDFNGLLRALDKEKIDYHYYLAMD